LINFPESLSEQRPCGPCGRVDDDFCLQFHAATLVRTDGARDSRGRNVYVMRCVSALTTILSH
jgi:hypothetical protein